MFIVLQVPLAPLRFFVSYTASRFYVFCSYFPMTGRIVGFVVLATTIFIASMRTMAIVLMSNSLRL